MFDVHQLLRWLSAERPPVPIREGLSERHRRAHREGGLDVLLSSRPFPGERRFDLWLPDLGVAVELRRKTSRLEVDCGGESFALRTHGAQPRGRCYFLNDLARLERVTLDLPEVKRGIAVLLTNDALYWEPPKTTPDTVDAAFRLHEGRVVSGKMAWSRNASPGTKKDMEEPIILRGSYPLRWRDYGQPFPRTNGRFRYLAVETSPRGRPVPGGLNAGARRCANRCFRERSARGWSCRYFRLAAIGYRVSLALPLPPSSATIIVPVRGEGDSFHLTVPLAGEPSNR